MNLNTLHSAYFVGIGGIGMSAIARFMQHRGVQVFGYDRTKSALCRELESAGMDIHYADDPEQIPTAFLDSERSRALVIYTPAVPKNHAEMQFLRDRGFEVLKRSEVLGVISKNYKTVAVAGTHGKTTTSAMVAHILTESGAGCNAFLGGISSNYNTNMVLDADSGIAVIEADEFDRSFLTLHPNWAVVTSMESDHMDIYGHNDELGSAFRKFVGQIEQGGRLFTRKGLDLHNAGVETEYYAVEETADISAQNVRVQSGAYHFDLLTKEHAIHDVQLGLPGRHNVENALAAAGVAMALKVDDELIKKALSSFKGVKRRFEVHFNSEELVYIDDYAHHPTEIKACVESVREMFPSRRITGVFQPHLYSRTRDLAEGFAESLSLLDEVILLEIYPAREEPIEGVNSTMLLDLIELENKSVMSGDELLHGIRRRQPDVLLTLGAGDIDQLVDPIKNALQA